MLFSRFKRGIFGYFDFGIVCIDFQFILCCLICGLFDRAYSFKYVMFVFSGLGSTSVDIEFGI